MASSKTDLQTYLSVLGGLEDAEIDLAYAALALAALSHPGISTDRYVHHLDTLVSDVGQDYAALCKNGAQPDVFTQLAALKNVLVGHYDYRGDQDTYDDLQNASLIRVVDRAKGLPITLCILYIHAARGQGWDIEGLNIPGHFLCRLEHEGQRVLFDPFHDCGVVEARDLRELIKKALGPQAELSAAYYEAASNRDILNRLQNNIKFRQIAAEDYAAALETVKVMRQIDPQEYRLLLDEGVLLARTDHISAAIDSLAAYIEKAPHSRDRMEAELLIRQLREQMH